MDPFSLLVGASGLSALCLQTLKLLRRYMHSAHSAASSASTLLNELSALHSSLQQLDAFLATEEARGSGVEFENTSALVSTTGACRSMLEDVSARLEGVAAKAGKGGLRQVDWKWPFREGECERRCEELRRVRGWVGFAVTVDGCQLMAKTSRDVLEVLGKQLDGFQVMERVERKADDAGEMAKAENALLQEDRELQLREKVLTWISSLDQEKRHHAISMPRVEDTGSWLLDRVEFKSWCAGEGAPNMLWCHGIQGSGKSVLASTVIEHLRACYDDEDMAVSFIYFDYRDQAAQSTEVVLASILKQIAASTSTVPEPVVEMYLKLGSKRQVMSLQDVEKTALRVCKGLRKVFIVVDALDECDAASHRRGFLKILAHLNQLDNVKLFVTSRPFLTDIEKALSFAPQIEIEADESDLRRYLVHEIEASGMADDIDEDFQDEIIDSIASKAGGFFLLPVLQIKSILEQPTAGLMEEALGEMPQDLGAAFDETIARIQRQPEGRRALGMNTLMWLSHAKSPLTVAQLGAALGIRAGQRSLNSRYCPTQKMMVECCLGLVTVDEETKGIRLVHYTMQEYLQTQRNALFRTGESDIAEKCMTYLSYDEFEVVCETVEELDELIEEHPFVVYAAVNWGRHCGQAANKDMNDRAFEFLQSASHRAMCNQISRFSKGFRRRYWKPKEVKSHSDLSIAADYGLLEVIERILKQDSVDVDAASGIGTTPLIRAASEGYCEVVRLLLAKGADPRKANWYGSSVHCAAEAGQDETLTMLLDHGIDVNIRDKFCRSPLLCAASRNHTSTMRLLMSRGAIITLPDSHGKRLIHHATEHGNAELVSAVLTRHPEFLNSRGPRGRTPLHMACNGGHVNVARILLEKNAAIEVEDEARLFPWNYAARAQGAFALQLLLLKAMATGSGTAVQKEFALEKLNFYASGKGGKHIPQDVWYSWELADLLGMFKRGAEEEEEEEEKEKEKKRKEDAEEREKGAEDGEEEKKTKQRKVEKKVDMMEKVDELAEEMESGLTIRVEQC